MTHSTEDHIMRSIEDLKKGMAKNTDLLTKIQVDIGILKEQRLNLEQQVQVQAGLISDHEKVVQRAYGWGKAAAGIAFVISIVIPLAIEFIFRGKQ